MFEALAKNALVPLVLRIGLAVIFIVHGAEKVSGQGNEAGSAWARSMPSPPAAAVQLAVAWGELVGGIALAAGFLTRLAAAGIAAIMAGAIATVTGKNGFSLLNHGFEYNFAILIMCAALILIGGGTLAIDRFLRFGKKTPAS